ncbi:unnamed protein product [Didymodactylos carnosus]|uniref:Uncharacterized protein n=1 Tax=Didymodactylos carnosus TaxID=1234261 RepID=A0A816DVV0_9BILA|nr:unnamed protein product [Didymodactylos carnosus]CAF1642576.1 unnamed protein product [Didymodactylos carnosus]CAF4444115.1 unnamed protein product [Didymodactylos carnosus]CAF4556412.1 unnamed protein product [Didymodactylos carnosus]
MVTSTTSSEWNIDTNKLIVYYYHTACYYHKTVKFELTSFYHERVIDIGIDQMNCRCVLVLYSSLVNVYYNTENFEKVIVFFVKNPLKSF